MKDREPLSGSGMLHWEGTFLKVKTRIYFNQSENRIPSDSSWLFFESFPGVVMNDDDTEQKHTLQLIFRPLNVL